MNKVILLAAALSLISLRGEDTSESKLIFDTGLLSVTWQIGTNQMSLNTNTVLITNWVNITPVAGLPKGTVIKAQEVGRIVTNLVMTVEYKGKTNEVVLETLGMEKWPSQQRERLVRIP